MVLLSSRELILIRARKWAGWAPKEKAARRILYNGLKRDLEGPVGLMLDKLRMPRGRATNRKGHKLGRCRVQILLIRPCQDKRRIKLAPRIVFLILKNNITKIKKFKARLNSETK